MHTVVQWFLENYLQLALIVFLLRYRQELIFTPLAGGNGKVQMNELAQFLILVVFIVSVYIEATRTSEAHIFSDEYFFALLMAVCAIAGIKHYFNKNEKHDENEAN